MRIGFDAKRYFNNQSGLGNYSRGIIRNLAELYPGHEYFLFNKHSVEESFSRKIKVINPESKSFFWRQFGIAPRAQKLNVEVFHGLSNEIPFGLKKHGIKSVVSIHDIIFKKFPSHYSIADRMIYDYKTRYALKNADAIIAISESVKEDLVHFYKADKNRIEVIYQFLEPQFYEEGQNFARLLEVPYFIYVSSFQHRKNHMGLLDAYLKVHKQIDQHLVLLGMAGETLEQAKTFVNKNGLETKVHFFINADTDTKTAFIKYADGFIYPSLDEGFGIPLAEAAMLNVPLAVSTIPVFKEIADKAAIYFHPNKSNEIASSILQLALPESRKRFYENRHIIVDKVSKITIGQKLINLYQSLN